MSRITITKPDDWHIHLRDGAMLDRTVNDVAAWANRAVVMPNLTPPVKTLADADAYRSRIMSAFTGSSAFELEGTAACKGRHDSTSIGIRVGECFDRWCQVGHDNRAICPGGNVVDGSVEHGAISQVNMPIVGFSDGDARHLKPFCGLPA